MIEASFGGGSVRDAAMCGAYQYDTGQRIRLHGLPSPEELAERDDFLSGDVVTVQAQFAYAGDSQTEARLASWDEMEGVWTANVPDVYMARCEDVHVYVYVSYGASEESSRAKTCYEAVFRPISRPAPSTQVTPDQVSAWDQLVAEVNLTLSTMETAISNANAATAGTNQAIEDAKTATQNAQSAADQIDGMSVEARTLPYNTPATASITDAENGKHIVFGIPQGKPGVFTLNGKTPDANGNITLTASDVGALTSSGTADNANKLGGVAADQYLKKSQVVNNLTTTQAGFVADARALKTMYEEMQWKTLSDSNGVYTIPACRELHIVFVIRDKSSGLYIFEDRLYLYRQISGAYRDFYVNGKVLSGTEYQMRVIKKTDNTFSISSAHYGSQDVTADAYLEVHYR